MRTGSTRSYAGELNTGRSKQKNTATNDTAAVHPDGTFVPERESRRYFPGVQPMILLKSLVKYCTVFAVNAKLTVDVSDRIGDITHGAGGFLYGVADEEVPTSNTLVPLKPKVLCTGTMLTTEHPYGDTEYVTEQFLEDGDSVYLVVTHPSGFHSYDNIVVSVKNVPAISSSSDLSTAYSTGGSYVLGQDVVTVSNAGTSDEGNLQNGSINGNGGIM